MKQLSADPGTKPGAAHARHQHWLVGWWGLRADGQSAPQNPGEHTHERGVWALRSDCSTHRGDKVRAATHFRDSARLPRACHGL